MLHTDVPSPDGFLYLSSPVWLTTGDDTTLTREPSSDPEITSVPQRAFHWHTSDTGIEVICYRARGEYSTGEDPLSPEEELELATLTPGIEFDWQFGDESWPEDRDIPQVGRFLKALWTIAQQR